MSDSASNGHSPLRPGLEHNRLEPFAGVFKARVKIFMGSEGSHESHGTMTNSWHVNGLFLHQEYVSNASDGRYPTFSGRGYWGYNTVLARYEGFWIDNASTMMHLETGHVGDSGKVWTMTSEIVHPHSRQKVKRRNVITLIDFDRHRMDAYMTGPDGKEIRTMEIEYVRN